MKKLLFLLLWVLFTIPVCVAADGDTFIQGDLKFTITSEDNHEVSVSAANDDYLGDVILPATITNENTLYSVKSVYFRKCHGLTSIVIPNTVTSINDYAFYECVNLISVEIPNSVISIGYEAFYCCFSLESLLIPNSVTSIGDEAFRYTGIKSVIIGNSVATIGPFSFYNCSSLWKVAYPNTISNPFPPYQPIPSVVYNPDEAIIEDGIVYGPDKTEILFVSCALKGEFIIPNNILSIGSWAFYRCKNIESVKIGESIKSFGEYAFYDCSRLTSITIPNSITSIADGVFCNCSGLITATISNSVTSIGSNAFAGCTNLTEIHFSNSLTIIKDYAFNSCINLKSIAIGNSLESIGKSAFYECSNLNDIYLGNSLSSIGAQAFANCENITTISSANPLPPECEEDVFKNVPEDAEIFVQIGSSELYKAANGWNHFNNYVETGVSSTIDNNCNGKTGYYDIYTLDGLLLKNNAIQEDIDALAPGIYIEMGKKY